MDCRGALSVLTESPGARRNSETQDNRTRDRLGSSSLRTSRFYVLAHLEPEKKWVGERKDKTDFDMFS